MAELLEAKGWAGYWSGSKPMKLPPPRAGLPVKVSSRSVEFSLWPVHKAQGGYSLSRKLFASDPWPLIRQAILEVQNKNGREAALAFAEQSQDFFGAAARAHTAAAKPLLLYYSFLNLAKALILVRSPTTDLDRAKHGLSEGLKPGGVELVDANLVARETNATSVQVFALLLHACGGPKIGGQLTMEVPMIMRQIVTGHRLLVEADKACDERFAAIEQAQVLHDPASLTTWLRFAIARTDLTHLGLTQTQFLEQTALSTDWQLVSEPDPADAHLLWIEPVQPTPYRETFIGNTIPTLIESVQSNVWQTVTAVPPYRRYYLLAAPKAEHPARLPQLLSAYALFFYLGSITRYRPHHFDRIVDGPYGAFVQSFVHEQPNQLLFLFASEFVGRDVARPALA